LQHPFVFFVRKCVTKWLTSGERRQRCPLCNQKLEISPWSKAPSSHSSSYPHTWAAAIKKVRWAFRLPDSEWNAKTVVLGKAPYHYEFLLMFKSYCRSLLKQALFSRGYTGFGRCSNRQSAGVDRIFDWKPSSWSLKQRVHDHLPCKSISPNPSALILLHCFMYFPLKQEVWNHQTSPDWWFGTFFISIIYGIILPID
jgi:hypothetical protein